MVTQKFFPQRQRLCLSVSYVVMIINAVPETLGKFTKSISP